MLGCISIHIGCDSIYSSLSFEFVVLTRELFVIRDFKGGLLPEAIGRIAPHASPGATRFWAESARPLSWTPIYRHVAETPGQHRSGRRVRRKPGVIALAPCEVSGLCL